MEILEARTCTYTVHAYTVTGMHTCLQRKQMDHCEKLLSPPAEIRERGFKEVMAFLYRVYEAQRTMVLDLAWLGLELLYINPETLSGLTRLNLSGNKFQTLPHQIPLLTRLMMTPALS